MNYIIIKLNSGNKDFIKRKINLIKLLDYGRNISYWINSSNVKNYFSIIIHIIY